MHKKRSIRGIVLMLAAAMATPMILTAWMLFMQARIRHEMLEKLEKENLEILVLGKDEIHWKEKGKELLIDGQLFDVFNMTPTAAGYQVSGLWDTAETAIKNKLDHTLEHQRERRAQGSLIYTLILGLTLEQGPEPGNPFIRFYRDTPGQRVTHTHLPLRPFLSQKTIPPDFS